MSWHEKEKQRYEDELRARWNTDGTPVTPQQVIADICEQASRDHAASMQQAWQKLAKASDD